MRQPFFSLAALAVFVPGLALAVGSEDFEPPTPTETTTQCPEGTVFDEEMKTCVPPEQSSEADSLKIEDIRELAWAGRHDDALALLATMEDQRDPLVLTYYGFVLRNLGDWDAGLAAYTAALAQDQALHLARSYMGQGHVERGELVLAAVQLREIERRGGAGTWAHASLADAIRTGVTVGY